MFLLASALASSLQLPYPMKRKKEKNKVNLIQKPINLRLGRQREEGGCFSSPYPTLQGSYEVGQSGAGANLATVHRAEGGKDLCLP